MVHKFSFENVKFKKNTSGDDLVIYGEVINCSGRDFSSVVFRFILLAKNSPLDHVILTINGFNNGRTRHFEKTIYGLAYSEVINKITGYEAHFEGGY